MASLKKAAARKSCRRKQQAPVRLPAERARIISSAAASRWRSRAAADDVADTSGSDAGSSYAPSTADGAPEPGGAAGDGPRAGGASKICAVRCCWPSGPGGGDLELQFFYCAAWASAVRLDKPRGACSQQHALSHLHASMQVAWRRAAATRCPCSSSGTTEQ
jgi:hypothetical protein